MLEEQHTRFTYMMLSRMQQDCEYYLNWGNRCTDRFVFGSNERELINEMKRLYDLLEVKPQWLSIDQINDYDQKMCFAETKE